MRRLNLQLLCCTLAGVLLVASLVTGETNIPSRAVVQADVKKDGPDKPKAKPKRAPGVTPEREAAALTFVKHHHRELFGLLESLSENQPDEYDKAMRDLFRVSERLAQIHENDPARYELELNLWKAQSHIELLTAQLRMSDSPQLRAQLRNTLAEKFGLQKMLFELERAKLNERVSRLDQQIERIETQSEQMVERQMDLLLRVEKTSKPKSEAP